MLLLPHAQHLSKYRQHPHAHHITRSMNFTSPDAAQPFNKANYCKRPRGEPLTPGMPHSAATLPTRRAASLTAARHGTSPSLSGVPFSLFSRHTKHDAVATSCSRLSVLNAPPNNSSHSTSSSPDWISAAHLPCCTICQQQHTRVMSQISGWLNPQGHPHFGWKPHCNA